MSDRPINSETEREVKAWAAGLQGQISEVAAADIAQRFGILDAVQHGDVARVRGTVEFFKTHPTTTQVERMALSALLDFSTQGGRY